MCERQKWRKRETLRQIGTERQRVRERGKEREKEKEEKWLI